MEQRKNKKVKYRKIRLTQGKYALVDAADFEWLSQWKWTYYSEGYAVRRKKDKPRNVYMHRLVLGSIPSGYQVDHKNGNGLDNRRGNLRVCTKSQNAMNRRVFVINKLGLKGVRRVAGDRPRPFVAQISFKNKSIYIGCFATAMEAHRAYCKRAKELFGVFACKG